VDLGAIMSTTQADPSQSLRLLMASSAAHVTGSERVRGVQTTRYAFNVDFKKLAHDNKALRQLTQSMGSVSAPAEAWIDAQGRVRRLVVKMTMGAQLATPMTMTMTEELYDFGVQANIAFPTDDMVVDFSALTKPSS
jgi:hypothetical protein